jgi:predicted ArsR family transcriptional regulator
LWVSGIDVLNHQGGEHAHHNHLLKRWNQLHRQVAQQKYARDQK